MAFKFKWLRDMGEWGGHVANGLTFLTTNWPATLAVIAAIGTGFNKLARGFVMTPAVYAGAGTFLFVLWTLIGLTVLVDRRKPRKVTSHQDYRYGLTFEDIKPHFVPVDALSPHAGSFSLGVQIRNYSPGPIRYSLEAADVRLKNRAIPKYKPGTAAAYMARGAGRSANAGLFDKAEMEQFYGAGLLEGTADYVFVYGPPDGSPIRRLTISLTIYVALPKDGVLGTTTEHRLGFSMNIESEQDDPI